MDVREPRRPRQERSAATRTRLLDAAHDCLLDGGFAATTLGAVQQRAGVARGTLLHHFPTRGALLAGVAEDVVARRLTLTGDRAADAGTATWDELVDAVWRELQGPAYAVVLELWVAARTDAELRAALLPVQEQLFATVHRGVTALVGEQASAERVPLLVQFTVDLLTGAHLAGLLRPRPGTTVVVEAWKDTLRTLAGPPPSGPPPGPPSGRGVSG